MKYFLRQLQNIKIAVLSSAAIFVDISLAWDYHILSRGVNKVNKGKVEMNETRRNEYDFKSSQ